MPSRLKPKSPRYLKGDHDVHSIPHTPDVSLPQVPRHADLRELWGQNSHCETRNSHSSAGWPSPHTPLLGHQENAPQHGHLLPLISWTALLPCRAVLACPTACPQSDSHPWDPRSPTQGQHSDGPFTPLHYFLAMETAWPQPEEPQHMQGTASPSWEIFLPLTFQRNTVQPSARTRLNLHLPCAVQACETPRRCLVIPEL